MRSPNKRNQHGFTIIELLVSMLLFSVVGAAIVTFLSDAFGRLGVESKTVLETRELKNAIGLIQSELRMSGSISPYNVGINASLVTCSAQLTTTSTTIRFLVSYDDPAAASGTQSYYVGYQYSAVDKTLYRGEVASGALSSCSLPAGDPISVTNRKVLSTSVIQIDANGDGTIDPVFSRSGNQLTINLGVQVTGPRGIQQTQNISSTVFARSI